MLRRDVSEIRIAGLSEEHGVLAADPARPLNIGQRIRIVPNHVCVVSNLFDGIWIEGEDGHLEQVAVDARGRVTWQEGGRRPEPGRHGKTQA